MSSPQAIFKSGAEEFTVRVIRHKWSDVLFDVIKEAGLPRPAAARRGRKNALIMNSCTINRRLLRLCVLCLPSASLPSHISSSAALGLIQWREEGPDNDPMVDNSQDCP